RHRPSPRIHSDNAPGVTLHRPCPASCQGCPVQLIAAPIRRFSRYLHNLWPPVAGLVPATHVLERGSINSGADVDGRAKPRPRGSWVVSNSPRTTNFAEPDSLGLVPGIRVRLVRNWRWMRQVGS